MDVGRPRALWVAPFPRLEAEVCCVRVYRNREEKQAELRARISFCSKLCSVINDFVLLPL